MFTATLLVKTLKAPLHIFSLKTSQIRAGLNMSLPIFSVTMESGLCKVK